MLQSRRSLFIAVLLCVVLVPSLGAKKPNSAGPKHKYFVDESKLPFDPLPDATARWGVHKGAAFRIEVPDSWNGGLVLWAHGHRAACAAPGDPNCELRPTSVPLAFRDVLVNKGFAWAASSYSVNGRDVAQAAEDTKSLGEVFQAMFGSPARTYLLGVSLGGGVSTLMVEQWPTKYGGALPACGVSDPPTQRDFSLHFNMVAATLADQEHRISFPMPEGVDHLTDIVPDIREALGDNEPPAQGFPWDLSAKGEQLKVATEILSGGPRPLFDEAFVFYNEPSLGNFLFPSFRDVRDEGFAPGNISGNADTIYQLDLDPALSAEEIDLNSRVPRDPTTPRRVI